MTRKKKGLRFIPADSACFYIKDDVQVDEQGFCLLASSKRRKTSSFVLLVFYSQTSSYSLCFLYF